MSNVLHSLLHHFATTQLYGLVSLCLFCSIFTGVVVWAFLQKKGHLDYMARAPLDDDPALPDFAHSALRTPHSALRTPHSPPPSINLSDSHE